MAQNAATLNDLLDIVKLGERVDWTPAQQVVSISQLLIITNWAPRDAPLFALQNELSITLGQPHKVAHHPREAHTESPDHVGPFESTLDEMISLHTSNFEHCQSFQIGERVQNVLIQGRGTVLHPSILVLTPKIKFSHSRRPRLIGGI